MPTPFLDTLKNKLVTAKDFKQVFDYFMDQIDDEFMAKGHGVRHDIIQGVIEESARQFFKDKKFSIKAGELRLTKIPEDKFIHGCALTSSGKMINVFYFEEIDTGLLAACEMGNDMTCVARFSARPASSMTRPSSTKPSAN